MAQIICSKSVASQTEFGIVIVTALVMHSYTPSMDCRVQTQTKDMLNVVRVGIGLQLFKG